MLKRPSETITGAVGTIVGSVITILAAYGFNIPLEVAGSVTILVSWISYAVTMYVAHRQRTGHLKSDVDGAVTDIT